MKKFLAILAIAGSLVACDNAGSGTSAEDSAKRAQDSIRREDSLKALQSTPPTTTGTDTTGASTMTGTDTTGASTTTGTDTTKK